MVVLPVLYLTSLLEHPNILSGVHADLWRQLERSYYRPRHDADDRDAVSFFGVEMERCKCSNGVMAVKTS